ncbi:MAG: hypothetical protein HQK53_00105 [Oligoflexia bacterium]|nr:hypothetical protein [Oligoflexia bacterium]
MREKMIHALHPRRPIHLQPIIRPIQQIYLIFSLIFLLLAFPDSTVAQKEGRVLELSNSKSTFLLNHGNNDNIKMGDEALFYLETKDYKVLKNAMLEIGTAKVSKIYPTYSIWYFQGLLPEAFNYIQKNAKVVFFIFRYYEPGTTDPINKKVIVFKHKTKYKLSEIKDSEDNDQPLNLIRKPYKDSTSIKLDLLPNKDDGDFSEIFSNDIKKRTEAKREERIKALKRRLNAKIISIPSTGISKWEDFGVVELEEPVLQKAKKEAEQSVQVKSIDTRSVDTKSVDPKSVAVKDLFPPPDQKDTQKALRLERIKSKVNNYTESAL